VRSTFPILSLAALLGLSMPAPVHALPCEEEVAKAAQALDVENRQILALELTSNSPQVQAFRRQYNLRFQVFLQMKAECDLAVRGMGPGSAPAGGTGGCARDTDCKGDRICVQGACVNP
jgi:hypothetical protein